MSLILRRGYTVAARAPKEPLIAIIGATGTGKSKLAIELATRFNGEIINGDAVQMYKGLPIITNKIPENERNGIPHHLLDFIELHEDPWTVRKFVREAEKIVAEIRSRGKLPILVGGTHYYTHGLLLNDALVSGGNLEYSGGPETQTLPVDILSAPTESLYARLQELDPDMAGRWHPRDRRKILRSLELYHQTGRKPSDIYEEQRQQQNTAPTGPENRPADADGAEMDETLGMRYPTLIFWIEAQDEVLKARLNARVHDMFAAGLLEEAYSMADVELKYEERGCPADKSKGIWVSIGYKELEPFIKAIRGGNVNSCDTRSMLDAGVEAIQAGTRQYAKRQNRYIRIRLANALRTVGAIDKLFVLDGTDLDQWEDLVTQASCEIVEAFLGGNELPDPKDLSPLAGKILSAIDISSSRNEPSSSRTCEICNKVLMTENEWQGHLKSRGHRNIMQRDKRRAENDARLRAAQMGATD